MVQQVARRVFGVCVLSAVGCLLSTQVRAAVPHLIRYQGQASDVNGVPLEGPYSLTFRLYDAETLGTVVWQETQATVTLTKGNFSILLGQVTPLTVDWSVPLWLSIQVGTATELSPRQRITSVPLAIRAEVAEQLAGGPTDISARVYNNANLSIANATETYPTFNTEQWDTDTIHDTALNTDRLTATTAGKYYVFATVLFADNATGIRQVTIEHSGCGCDIARFTQKAADSPFVGGITLGTHYNFTAGQYVRVRVYQNSGGALNVIANGVFPSFGMVKVQ